MKIILILAGLLLCLEVKAQTFEEGEINGAPFMIIVPENWNGGLVMYAHGYEETEEFIWEEEEYEEEEQEVEGEPVEEEGDEFTDIFTRRGYAFAASEYRKKGLVIKEGMEDTEALRAYFADKYGQPAMTIMTGHSMGGMITIATIERYPSEYQGALPLCGWLAPVHTLFKSVLDLLVTYDYLFGPNDGKIVLSKELVPLEDIEKNLKGKKAMVDRFAEHFSLRNEHLPQVIAFGQGVIKESTHLWGGMPVGNLETIYSGFGFEDEALNRNLKRYASSPRAEEYVLSYNTPNGQISDPVLALHTTYDELLPVHNYEYYQSATRIRQTDHLYHQQYVVRDGHCYFEPEEVAQSFDQLVNWIETGDRPNMIYK